MDSIIKNIKDSDYYYRVEFAGDIDDQVYIGEDYLNYVKEIIKENAFIGSVAEKVAKTPTDNDHIPYAFAAAYDGKVVKKSSITTKQTYGRIDLIKHLERYILHANPTYLAKYLTPYFKKKLQTSSPDEIVKEFGTHVLLDFMVGGRLTAYYTSTITHHF